MKAISFFLFSVLFLSKFVTAQMPYKADFNREEVIQFLNQELKRADPQNSYQISVTEEGKMRITRPGKRERIIDITVLEGASHRSGEVQAMDGFALLREKGSSGYFISLDRATGTTYGSIDDLPDLGRAKNILSAMVQLKALLKAERAGGGGSQPVKASAAGTNRQADEPATTETPAKSEKVDYDNITSEGLYEMLNQLILEKGVGEKNKVNGTKYGFIWSKGISMDLLEMSEARRYSNTVFLHEGLSVVEYKNYYGLNLQASKLDSKGEPIRYLLAKFNSKSDAEKAFDILVSLVKNARTDAAAFLERNKSLNDYLPSLERWIYFRNHSHQVCLDGTYIHGSWLDYDHPPVISYRLEAVSKPVESLKEALETANDFTVTRNIYTVNLSNLCDIAIKEAGSTADCETGEVVVYFNNNSVDWDWTILYDKQTAREMKTKARQNKSFTWGFSIYFNPAAIDSAKMAETLNILKLIARK